MDFHCSQENICVYRKQQKIDANSFRECFRSNGFQMALWTLAAAAGEGTKGSMNEREKNINRNFLLKEIDFKVCSCCCIHLSTYNFDLPFWWFILKFLNKRILYWNIASCLVFANEWNCANRSSFCKWLYHKYPVIYWNKSQQMISASD